MTTAINKEYKTNKNKFPVDKIKSYHIFLIQEAISL